MFHLSVLGNVQVYSKLVALIELLLGSTVVVVSLDTTISQLFFFLVVLFFLEWIILA